jgi:hypothetical protein
MAGAGLGGVLAAASSPRLTFLAGGLVALGFAAPLAALIGRPGAFRRAPTPRLAE